MDGMQDTRVIRATFHVHFGINSERTVNVSKFLHAKKEKCEVSDSLYGPWGGVYMDWNQP